MSVLRALTRALPRTTSRRRRRILAGVILGIALLASTLTAPSPAEASTNNTQAEVTRWYWEALGRAPDPGGLAYWKAQALGRDVNQFKASAYAFLVSPEFVNRYPDIRDRTTVLYRAVLDRAPDQAGIDYWVWMYNTGQASWHDILYSFAFSTEAHNRYWSIIRGDCGIDTTIPWAQQYWPARGALSGEETVIFGLEQDTRLGIVVAELWIRGPDRQAISPWLGAVPGMPIPGSFRFELGVDSDRGNNRFFQPTDTRGFIVLDYATAWGYVMMNHSTLNINIRWAPDFQFSANAFDPQFGYGLNAPSWAWEDNPAGDRHRLRYHLTPALPLTSSLPGWAQAAYNTISPSIDHQILIDPYGGINWQGEDMPNVALYHYDSCDGIGTGVLKFYNTHPDSDLAWLNLLKRTSWWYDQAYSRT